ncbi:hypothetical protein [Amycolatopsis palatopharyngis]|uniref:hypothetical protein n=1 Tax=Amycolatopsis palatopharyngis TaxID=187982 RepID=UPI000E27E33D|nr:hypothetical protein [Amycolatopsis palatopharyngis]
MTDDDRRYWLAECLDQRRIDLDFSWEEVAEGAGMTTVNLRRIRNNKGGLPGRTKRKLQTALKLCDGAIDSLMAGYPGNLEPDSPEWRDAALQATRALAESEPEGRPVVELNPQRIPLSQLRATVAQMKAQLEALEAQVDAYTEDENLRPPG